MSTLQELIDDPKPSGEHKKDGFSRPCLLLLLIILFSQQSDFEVISLLLGL